MIQCFPLGLKRSQFFLWIRKKSYPFSKNKVIKLGSFSYVSVNQHNHYKTRVCELKYCKGQHILVKKN